MDLFKRLLEAKTETAFFVILSNFLHAGPVAKIRSHMSSIHENGEDGLRLTLEQTLAYLQPDGIHHTFRAENTHIFTLYQSGRLEWWMKDQPTITGLHNIQAALGRLRQSTEQVPDGV